MKRCPECRRDYYDDTLLFCLEDGTTLLQGSVPPPDEPATMILHEPSAPNETATRAQLHTTEAESQGVLGYTEKKQGFPPDIAAKPLRRYLLAGSGLLLLLLAGGFLAYRYFSNSAVGQIDSIAVMPFVNDGANPEVEYLADGMTESLIKSLSLLPNLAVKARSTVFSYKGKQISPKGIGEELNVQAVLLGRVVQRGEDLKLSLELVNTQTQDLIWTEHYDRKPADIVTLQSDIARDVSNRIRSRLSGAEERDLTKKYTENPEAYQLYLKGRFYWNKRNREDVIRASEYLTSATEKDPTFALAFAGLADCWALSASSSDEYPADKIRLTKLYASKAIELDSSLGEPHATLGMIAATVDNDPVTGERELTRAIELNPNYATAYHWYSRYLRRVGRDEEAYVAIKRAEELDPLSIAIMLNIGEVYFERGDLDAAMRAARQAIEIDKLNRHSHRQLATFLTLQGKYEEALSEVERFAELSDKTDAITIRGWLYGMSGRKNEAEAAIVELKTLYSEKKATGDDLAVVYTALGDQENAFRWLEEEIQQRKFRITDVALNIRLRPLRGNSRWKDLLQQAGVPE